MMCVLFVCVFMLMEALILIAYYFCYVYCAYVAVGNCFRNKCDFAFIDGIVSILYIKLLN